MPHQKPRLGLFDLTVIVISLVIGMGIFKAPSLVAAESPAPSWFFAAWIAGGIIALCGALTYAEIGSRYPVMGGYYRIFAYCYHPMVGFIINVVILVSNAISTAGVALIGAEYLVHAFFPVHLQTAFVQQVVAICSIIIFFIVNMTGLRMSAATQNILMGIKILMMLTLLSSLFIPVPQRPAPVSTSASFSVLQQLRMFGAALIAVTFTYEGYQQTINFGAEVNRPGRTMPRGIVLAMAIILPLYLLMNWAYVRVIGFDQLPHTQAIAARLAGTLFGHAADQLFSLLLFISVLGYVNVSLLSNPRVVFAMSEDGILPAIFKRRQAEKQILFPALLLFTMICVGALFASNQFSVLLNYTIFLDCMGMASSAATIFILRKRIQVNPKEQYVMKGYPWIPALFILAYVAIAISIAMEDIYTVWFSVLLSLVCGGIYLILKMLTRRKQISNQA